MNTTQENSQDQKQNSQEEQSKKKKPLFKNDFLKTLFIFLGILVLVLLLVSSGIYLININSEKIPPPLTSYLIGFIITTSLGGYIASIGLIISVMVKQSEKNVVDQFTDLKDFMRSEIKTSETNIGIQIDKLDGRVDKLEGRIDKLDGKISAVETTLIGRIDTLTTSVNNLREDVAFIKGKLDK